MLLFVFSFHQGDTLDYLGIPGLHLAGSQGVIVIAICQAILMVTYDKQSYFLWSGILLVISFGQFN